MLKYCNGCQRRLPLDAFGLKASSPTGRQSRCKDCRNAYGRSWYAENAELHGERVRSAQSKRIEVNRQWALEFMASGCVDCGETDPRCLDFDHVVGVKEYQMSTLICEGYLLEKVISEAEKCVIRCANCHRKRSSDTLGWWTSLGSVAQSARAAPS